MNADYGDELDDVMSRMTDENSVDSTGNDNQGASDAQDLTELQAQVEALRKAKVGLTMTNIDALRKVSLVKPCLS